MLTLDLTFDQNPQQLAWSVTNVEDDLPLSFKWFDWYGTNFITAKETLPIYGNERGQQQYIFTVLDLQGNGMCCTQGMGSFSLYLGDSDSGSLIATGGQFTTDKSFIFEINSAGLVSSPASSDGNSKPGPTKQPTSPPGGYYIAPATGICQVNDQSRPEWVLQVFADFDECCQSSWNKKPCLAANPVQSFDQPPANNPTPADDPPPADPTTSSSIGMYPPLDDEEGALAFTPVTGSFTCRAAGMTCTIRCTQCGSIQRVASKMAMEFPSKSTIKYTAERGTDDYPEEPSRLILVESDTAAGNVISCDEGCICNSVNDSVLGCGLIAKPTEVQYTPIAPSPTQQPDTLNSSAHTGGSLFLIPSMLLVWAMLR